MEGHFFCGPVGKSTEMERVTCETNAGNEDIDQTNTYTTPTRDVSSLKSLHALGHHNLNQIHPS